MAAMVVLSGCRRSPSFNVLGSYFPGWIACILLGIISTALLRWLMNRFGLERRIPLLPLFYLCLTLLIACSLWLIAFE
jgi:uncharacterized membrane protein YeaQ/YmgE (transglycosylase-associated protein family)